MKKHRKIDEVVGTLSNELLFEADTLALIRQKVKDDAREPGSPRLYTGGRSTDYKIELPIEDFKNIILNFIKNLPIDPKDKELARVQSQAIIVDEIEIVMLGKDIKKLDIAKPKRSSAKFLGFHTGLKSHQASTMKSLAKLSSEANTKNILKNRLGEISTAINGMIEYKTAIEPGIERVKKVLKTKKKTPLIRKPFSAKEKETLKRILQKRGTRDLGKKIIDASTEE